MSQESKNDVLVLSLDDTKTQELANSITRGAGKRILDYLGEHEATESEIAEALRMPLSTVHFNIKQLKKSGLVDWERYHYSEKGKEVRHYRATRKCIVITPSGFKGSLGDLFKSVVPGIFFTVAAAGLWYVWERFPSTGMHAQENVRQDSMMAAQSTMETASEPIGSAAQSTPEFWLGILIGGGLFFLGVMIWHYLSRRPIWKKRSD